MKVSQIDPTDLQILRMIVDNLTFQEMADELGLAARSAVFKRVNKLIANNLVHSRPTKARSRKLTEDGRQLLNALTPGEKRPE